MEVKLLILAVLFTIVAFVLAFLFIMLSDLPTEEESSDASSSSRQRSR